MGLIYAIVIIISCLIGLVFERGLIKVIPKRVFLFKGRSLFK